MSVFLQDKKKKLAWAISRESRVAVACSGGADSTLLVRVCSDVLGRENVLAVFVETPLLPGGESIAVRELVRKIGCRLHIISLDPLSWPDFVANPRERCYLCKKRIYQTLQKELSERGFHVLMDGTNLDDLNDFRPGLKALDELGIKRPLAEAGLTKKDVRRLSRELELTTWNKHSSSCLATRIATSQQITRDKLLLVQRCEDLLADSGFMGCRVRISGECAQIELLEEDIGRFAQDVTRGQILKKINDFGLEKVFLALTGRKGIVL